MLIWDIDNLEFKKFGSYSIQKNFLVWKIFLVRKIYYKLLQINIDSYSFEWFFLICFFHSFFVKSFGLDRAKYHIICSFLIKSVFFFQIVQSLQKTACAVT